jgi:glycogen synthase
MKADFSWGRSGQSYAELYKRLLNVQTKSNWPAPKAVSSSAD